MKKILGCIRRADDQFGLVQSGDTVAVGVSGGKDSTLLLYAMALYRKFCRRPFTLKAITLDMGFDGFDAAPLQRLCDEIGVEYTVKKTDIKEVVFDIRKEKNPCALCAKLRRGALHGAANELGANKVALGHHREDVLETLLLSLFYEGRLHTMAPSTYLGRCGLTLIRPMVFLPEKEVIGTVRRLALPIIHNPCPANGYTKREDMKQLLEYFSKNVIADAPNRMIGALARTDQYQLWDKPRTLENDTDLHPVGGE